MDSPSILDGLRGFGTVDFRGKINDDWVHVPLNLISQYSLRKVSDG